MIFDIETTGLAKETERITCISYCSTIDNQVHTNMNQDEKILIEDFFIELNSTNEMITFNGDSFDIPFLIYRAFVTGAKGPTNFRLPKHIDLRKIAGCFFYNYEKFAKGSLNDYAKLLGEETKLTNGLAVVQAWKDQDLALIKEHCEYDVLLTVKLYKRCKEIGLI